MNPRRATLVLVIAVWAGGCAIGPTYQRPADVLPADAYRGVVSAGQAESFADLDWVEAFQDPELDRLIRLALDNNLDLMAAAARVEEFRALSRVSRAAFGPEIRAGVSTAPSPASDEDSSYSAGLSLSWEIDLFGRLRRANEAARAQMLAEEDNARAVMASLVAAVAASWFELRQLDAEVDIIRRTIEAQQASLALVQSQNRNGIASGTEVQQAVAQLATTRSQLPIALQRSRQAENTLRFLLGYPPDAVARTPAVAMPLVPPTLPVGLPAQLLARRPDLRGLENTLHAATAQVGVAQAARFPYLSLGLTSFFGLVSPELGRLLDGDDPSQDLFSIGPFLDAPLWRSGAGSGNVDAAWARARQAELAYRAGVLQSLREVADALDATERLREVIGLGEERVAASSEVLRLQRMRYRSGVVSYIEVLDAERQLFSAEVDLSRARRDHLTAYVTLYRSLGGGWSDAEIGRLLAAAAP